MTISIEQLDAAGEEAVCVSPDGGVVRKWSDGKWRHEGAPWLAALFPSRMVTERWLLVYDGKQLAVGGDR